jgi:predicted transposase/invertase (TIGR01784 family)
MVYPDSSEIHILEVQKAEKAKNAKDSALVNWLKFFAAETKEEFEMAAHTSSSIAKAWGIVQHLSGDEKARMIAEYEEMARRDQEDRLMGARREGELAGKLEANQVIARNLLKKNFSWDDVAEITGLSLNEIKELSQKNTH